MAHAVAHAIENPADNAADYKAGSPITHAAKLKGNLLIVHGTGDDNCHYQGTERLMEELIAKGKRFSVLPYPSRLRLLAWPMGLATFIKQRPGLLALLPPRLRALTKLAPDSPASPDLPERTPSTQPAARLRVGLVTGCVQRVFFGPVNHATARVLAAEGCDVLAPASQGCCGALALHAGEREQARAFARLRAAWPGVLMLAGGGLVLLLPPVAELPVFGYVSIALLLVGDAASPLVTTLGLWAIWIAAALTLITGYDYLRTGLRHMAEDGTP